MADALSTSAVRRIYDAAAKRYDLQHALITLRSDQRGRRMVVELGVAEGDQVLVRRSLGGPGAHDRMAGDVGAGVGRLDCAFAEVAHRRQAGAEVAREGVGRGVACTYRSG